MKKLLITLLVLSTGNAMGMAHLKCTPEEIKQVTSNHKILNFWRGMRTNNNGQIEYSECENLKVKKDGKIVDICTWYSPNNITEEKKTYKDKNDFVTNEILDKEVENLNCIFNTSKSRKREYNKAKDLYSHFGQKKFIKDIIDTISNNSMRNK